MPKIRVLLEDDTGEQTERTFALQGNWDTLDAIDEVVEQFKNDAPPKIEQELLHQTRTKRRLT